MEIKCSGSIADLLDPFDFITLIGLHGTIAGEDQKAKQIVEREWGAFTSTIPMRNTSICLREEYGYRGHVLYIMSERELASDNVDEWVEIDGLIPGFGKSST